MVPMPNRSSGPVDKPELMPSSLCMHSVLGTQNVVGKTTKCSQDMCEKLKIRGEKQVWRGKRYLPVAKEMPSLL